MNRYTITIAWRGSRWTLRGRARSTVAMFEGIATHVPVNSVVKVKPSEDVVNHYAERMLRRDQVERLEGRP